MMSISIVDIYIHNHSHSMHVARMVLQCSTRLRDRRKQGCQGQSLGSEKVRSRLRSAAKSMVFGGPINVQHNDNPSTSLNLNNLTHRVASISRHILARKSQPQLHILTGGAIDRQPAPK